MTGCQLGSISQQVTYKNSGHTWERRLVVVVEWLYYSKRIIIVRWADLSDFFSLIFVG